MFYFDATTTPDPQGLAFLFNIVGGILTGAGGAFIAWLFMRRKNDSEIEKNDSDTDKNHAEESRILHEIIRGLRQDIDGFLTKMAALKIDAENLEQSKRDLTRQLNEAADEFAREQAAEFEDLADTVIKLQMVFKPIADAVAGCVNHPEIRRESIRISEMLYSLKARLQR